MATFLLTIATGPDRISESRAAHRFATSALQASHQLSAIFFWQDGVLTALEQQQPPGDEWHAMEAWQSLSSEFNVPLICCSSASLRRGILDQTESSEVQLPTTLASGFRIGGLGELVVLSREADRVMQF
jgi:tRNA 2-thiouridine synthesizing protein D